MAAEGDASPRRAPARPARNEMMKMRPCMYDVRVDADGGQTARRYDTKSAHWRLVPAEGSHGVCDACASALGIMCRVSSRGVIPDQ